MNLVIKDALWQILGRVASALGGFIVIKIITPYLGPLRFGDYSTILKYFAIWSAFADFGIYVIALKQLGKIKGESSTSQELLQSTYNKFVSTRVLMIMVVYTLALVVAYLIPAYTQNPYLIRGLPLGMLFSASFMSAGILQIPLQIFRKMEQLSIALILARIAQIGILVVGVYFAFSDINFSEGVHILPFLVIIFSVFASGVVQAIYVRRTGRKHLALRREWDRSFIRNIICSNRQYGLAYYLSSFHTLLVLMLLSRMYPTVQGYTYVGVRALALSLIEILLIVPSALGNSLIHKVSGEDISSIKKRYGGLLELVLRIGCYCIVMFTLFAPHIIGFIGGEGFLSDESSFGSDRILPFLSVVLTLSFIKQVFNYIFVTTGHQNALLKINLFGVTIGIIAAVPLILHYQLIGGIIAQLILEVLFVSGSLYVARKKKVIPSVHISRSGVVCLCCVLLVVGIPTSLIASPSGSLRIRLIQGVSITALLTALSYHHLRHLARKL